MHVGMSEIVDNRKIAKNTFYLYLRMIISMVVSLYTSRVIIQVLGIDDYGIYNIVGGVIVLFSFVSTSLKNSTQRFLSYQLGKNDSKELNRVLSMSLQCHLIYAAIFIVLSLTIGLWFVIEKLNIPESRYSAALVVYGVSIITFLFSIFQAPYQAAILSHEQMSFYALISVFEVVLKLVVVFALTLSRGDKLIIYSFLVLFVTIVSLALAMVYCYSRLPYKKPSYIKDKELFKQFFGYTGWSMFSGCAYIGAQQGGNILVNIFNGVAANGAFGIANQVTNILYSFVSNFQSAFNPQIVKSYSAGQSREMLILVNRTSYFSYYIFLIIAIPVLVKIDYLLALWLGSVPDYSAVFCRLLLIYFLVDSIEAPLWMLIGATGKMKFYSLWLGVVTLMNIPISLVLLRLGWSIYWVFIIRVVINIIIAIIRPFHLRALVPSFSIRAFFKEALMRPAIVTLLLIPIVYSIQKFLNFVHPLLIIIALFFITILLIWMVGLNKSDKNLLINDIRERCRHDHE